MDFFNLSEKGALKGWYISGWKWECFNPTVPVQLYSIVSLLEVQPDIHLGNNLGSALQAKGSVFL